MNPSGGPLSRAAIAKHDVLNQQSHGHSPNVVNVPQQARFQASGKPPPLPPIPPQMLPYSQMNVQSNMGYPPMNRYSNYQGFGHSFNNFYGGYRGLSNQYPIAGFMGNYNNSMPFDSNNSSSPFSSIELFVQTVSSLSMMLESTLSATYASMQAIAGVMDNCSRLRQYLINFVKLGFTVQFFRNVLNFCKWVLRFIRGKTIHSEEESVWNAAKTTTIEAEVGAEVVESGSVWPLAAFFGLLLAGPYFVKRFFNSSTLHNDVTWDPKIHERLECVAIYDFIPTQEGCLKLRAGEIIFIPKIQHFNDWCPAMNMNNQVGLVPLNRIRPIQRKVISEASKTVSQETAKVTKEGDNRQKKPPGNLTTTSETGMYSVDLKPLEGKTNAIKSQETSK